MTWMAHTLHELFACCPDVFRECCREHHYLLMVRRRAEDFLDISAHVCVGGT